MAIPTLSAPSEIFKKWEGRVLEEKFSLVKWLGGSDHSVVFLTGRSGQSPQQAIKLVSANGFSSRSLDEDTQLARWRESAKLSHPNLVRLWECGRTTIDHNDFLYLVMEFAEEDLSQILPQRALSTEEVGGMLAPLAEAIAFLHGAGFVHGRMQPSNVMAVNDQLRISIDGLSKQGEFPTAKRGCDAPELASSGFSREGDVWSLGALLVQAFRPNFSSPELASGRNDAAIPENMPSPTREIAQRALLANPQERCTISGILASLNGSLPPSQALVAPSRLGLDKTFSEKTAAQKTIKVNPVNNILDPPAALQQPNSSTHSPRSTIRPIAILLISLAVLIGALLFARKSAVKQAPPSSAVAASQFPLAIQRPTTDPHASQAPATPIAESSSAPTGNVRGKVLDRVLPELSRTSQRTIRGRVKVAVEVSADQSGAVTSARLTSAGPSKYFAGRSLEAARHWKFEAPKVGGESAPSKWLLRFEIGRNMTQVFPSQISP